MDDGRYGHNWHKLQTFEKVLNRKGLFLQEQPFYSFFFYIDKLQLIGLGNVIVDMHMDGFIRRDMLHTNITVTVLIG